MPTIVTLPGDGIGPEIMAPALELLRTISEDFSFEEHPFGGAAIDLHGTALTDETLAACKPADAVLLAAVGGPKWDTTDPDAPRPEQGLLGLRKGMGLYANLRPVRPVPALYDASPLKRERIEGTDLLVVRELTGGIYFGEKTRTARSASDLCFYTVDEVDRIAHVAFDAARLRRKKVASVDKANVLETSRQWREVVHIVHKARYNDIELTDVLVDNAAMQLIARPADFDVIVTENLFGDILSDEAAMITGSIGMLPSASLGERGDPGLFEPVHGSAPDIAGTGAANPLAMFLSAALMLRHGLRLGRRGRRDRGGGRPRARRRPAHARPRRRGDDRRGHARGDRRARRDSAALSRTRRSSSGAARSWPRGARACGRRGRACDYWPNPPLWWRLRLPLLASAFPPSRSRQGERRRQLGDRAAGPQAHPRALAYDDHDLQPGQHDHRSAKLRMFLSRGRRFSRDDLAARARRHPARVVRYPRMSSMRVLLAPRHGDDPGVDPRARLLRRDVPARRGSNSDNLMCHFSGQTMRVGRPLPTGTGTGNGNAASSSAVPGLPDPPGPPARPAQPARHGATGATGRDRARRARRARPAPTGPTGPQGAGRHGSAGLPARGAPTAGTLKHAQHAAPATHRRGRRCRIVAAGPQAAAALESIARHAASAALDNR